LLGLTHHPDLFHLLRPLALFGARFYRQAWARLKRVQRRVGRRQYGGSHCATARDMQQHGSGGRKKSNAKITFGYLWGELRRALESL